MSNQLDGSTAPAGVVAARYAFRGTEILVSAGADLAVKIEADLKADLESSAAAGTSVLDSRSAPLAVPFERLAFPAGPVAELYEAGVAAPEGWEWRPFRGVIGAIPETGWRGAARALAFVNWRASTRYCGRCGSPNGDKPDEIARLCPSCGALSFPRISPAVLAVVMKGNRILLARNALNKTGRWSILAGFVEPGETFEGCVHREVLEEVSVEVAADGYLGSQPWPFPDQLMVGFLAHWKSGELRPDGVEIAEAGWFGPDDHPPLPMHGSLSRRLIDAAFARIR
jgi:NAD+ diphosphatase